MKRAKHIYQNAKGYRVQIRRGGRLVISGFIACVRDASAEQHTQALARASALRDRFLKIVGAAKRTKTKGNSNTGVPGISEMVQWHRNKPTPCFSVCLGKRRQRILFGSLRSRETAWNMALQLRRNIGAEIPDTPAAGMDSFLDTEVLP